VEGVGGKMTYNDWDNLIIIDLLNQFFWIVMEEWMGDWYSMYKSDVDLNYWSNRLERDFEEYGI
jgi:hypothetical protein